MSGHNKWSQIKNQKGAADKKRGQLFSKMLKAVSVAAKEEPNPDFNPRLRSLIEKAKENNVPAENIERAIKKAAEEKNLEELVIEAYGPEKVALIIEAITDNRNRTIAEVRHILDENGAKMATPGSVLWSFTKTGGEWQPNFRQQVSDEGKEKILSLIEKLEENEDVQKVTTNIANSTNIPI